MSVLLSLSETTETSIKDVNSSSYPKTAAITTEYLKRTTLAARSTLLRISYQEFQSVRLVLNGHPNSGGYVSFSKSNDISFKDIKVNVTVFASRSNTQCMLNKLIKSVETIAKTIISQKGINSVKAYTHYGAIFFDGLKANMTRISVIGGIVMGSHQLKNSFYASTVRDSIDVTIETILVAMLLLKKKVALILSMQFNDFCQGDHIHLNA
ncbi:hypothetical protein BY458DRAFT_557433 [Sporodiniella umbellata]|nr:hypothetical protein BY458DRAFT_557433 [Sporodiniella umbellata]